jgi:CRISPR-associated endonuclease/helicase Cas3
MADRNCFISHFRKEDNKEQCLWEHLVNTAKLASEYAAKIGLRKCGEVIGLSHDLGKATGLFDQYIRSAVGLIDPDEDDYLSADDCQGKIDHSSAGAQLIYNHLNPQGGQARIVAQYLALAIASHHSGIIDCLTPDGMNRYEARMKKAFESTRVEEAEGNLDSAIKDSIYSLLADPSLIKEITDKTEDIKESIDTKSSFSFKQGLLLRMLFSCLIDADRTDTIRFEKSLSLELKSESSDFIWTTLSERLEAHLGKFKVEKNIDQIRVDISDQCLKYATKDKGVFQLTVPTGGGKTLSSLRFAINHAMEHKMDRIIYVIPYTSIIDQNADKVREILEPSDERSQIVLEHHSNLTPEKENEMQKMLAQNWDAPVVFTTMVQFLETLFGGGTRSARRMHQLANAVIIFDEIQTLPIKCVHMFNLAIRFLVKACGTTVVLCTATQPLLDEIRHSSLSLPDKLESDTKTSHPRSSLPDQ